MSALKKLQRMVNTENFEYQIDSLLEINLFITILNVVKEQQSKIENLQGQITYLESRVKYK